MIASLIQFMDKGLKMLMDNISNYHTVPQK